MFYLFLFPDPVVELVLDYHEPTTAKEEEPSNGQWLAFYKDALSDSCYRSGLRPTTQN